MLRRAMWREQTHPRPDTATNQLMLISCIVLLAADRGEGTHARPYGERHGRTGYGDVTGSRSNGAGESRTGVAQGGCMWPGGVAARAELAAPRGEAREEAQAGGTQRARRGRCRVGRGCHAGQRVARGARTGDAGGGGRLRRRREEELRDKGRAAGGARTGDGGGGERLRRQERVPARRAGAGVGAGREQAALGKRVRARQETTAEVKGRARELRAKMSVRAEKERERKRAMWDKRVRARQETTMGAEGRAREMLLLLVMAGIEVGRCGGGKLLFLVTVGIAVGRRGAR